MIVQCAKCGTKFRLDETKIGQRGAKVRCSKCQHSFVVKAPAVSEAATAVQGLPTGSAPKPRPARADTDPTMPSPPPRGPPPLELDDTSGPSTTPALPDLPPGSDTHDAQTAVYMVPPEIRAAAQQAAELELDDGPTQAPALPSNMLDLDSDEPTGVVSPEVLAAARAASGTPKRDTLPPLPRSSPSDFEDVLTDEAMLVDDADVTDVTEGPVVGDSTAVIENPLAAAAATGHQDLFPGAGEDPFAAGGDPFAGAGGLSADGTFIPPSGPEEALIGRVEPKVLDTGETALPPSAAPTTPLPPVVAKTDKDAPRKSNTLVKVLTSIAGLAALGFGVLLYLGGGRLDLSVVGLAPKRTDTGEVIAPRSYEDVHPTSMRSVLYPTRSGRRVLVFVGNAENRSAQPRTQIDVVAEIRNRDGRLVATDRAPLGLALSPPEVAALTDRESLNSAFEKLVLKVGQPEVKSRETAPFTVVVLDPPSGLADLEHNVRLDKGEQIATPQPEPEPPEVQPEPETPDRSKGKRKRKGKRRRGKRKAKE